MIKSTKLAVVILGEQNSGKTETLREIVKMYTGTPQKQMRAGWRYLSIYPSVRDLRLQCFFVPASPSETDIQLKDRFPDWQPDVLFLAEQINGKHLENSMKFLEQKEYEVFKYTLSNKDGIDLWDRYNSKTEKEKLKNRARFILNEVRNKIEKEILQ